MIKSFDKYQINIFDITSLLNSLKEENVIIYNLNKTSSYTYTFLASPYCRNRIKKVLDNPVIIKKVGLFNIFENFIKYKTTLLSLIIAIVLFFLCANKIWKVNITGDSTTLFPLISQQLEENNIKKGMDKINNEKILMIEEKILYTLKDKIEWLEIRISGSTINAKFLKKRTTVPDIPLQNSLFATKDGLIHSFDVKNGEIRVKINDYVKKGDLLVSDSVTTDDGKDIYVGAYGSVYAYTWYSISNSITILNENDYDEAATFSNLLLDAKNKMKNELDENESIYNENVIQFIKEGKKVTLKVHFTCLEDITKE